MDWCCIVSFLYLLIGYYFGCLCLIVGFGFSSGLSLFAGEYSSCLGFVWGVVGVAGIL